MGQCISWYGLRKSDLHFETVEGYPQFGDRVFLGEQASGGVFGEAH